MPCPCCSGDAYSKCCKPYHSGKLPESALQLMRSRYSAYALCLPDYIVRTTHPDNPQFLSNTALWLEQIAEFCQQTQFKKLEILDFQESGSAATVTFIAHLAQNQKDASFKEKSHFEKIKGKWLYRSGQVSEG